MDWTPVIDAEIEMLYIAMWLFILMGVAVIVVPFFLLIKHYWREKVPVSAGKRKKTSSSKASEKPVVWYQCDCYACTYRKHYWRVGRHTDPITIGTGMPPQCLGVNRNNYYR